MATGAIDQAGTAAALAPVEEAMRRAIARCAPPDADADLRAFYGMMRYHLGWADATFAPALADGGKRFRPLLLVRCAEACGGDVSSAAPAAAAVELLHNFTLVHDDIQDESSHRRHRETIWRRWGASTAINVGDALYAVAHEALYALAEPPAAVPVERVLTIAREFDQTALRIVEGQHRDLSHEGQWGGGEARYLGMIAGKTAAIIACAARAGAVLAGAEVTVVETLGVFGQALGSAFQIRDDILGIWGAQEVTGKPAADDLRRRKQSLPLVAFDERAAPAARDEVRQLYGAAQLDEAGVVRTLALLNAAGMEEYCQAYVTHYHDEARAALDRLAPQLAHTEPLRAILDTLETRAS
jgi:geranylgeranyl diphosphate synthase, type I